MRVPLLAVLLLTLAACRHAAAPQLISLPSGDVAPLKAAFNDAVDRTRVLVLLSPT